MSRGRRPPRGTLRLAPGVSERLAECASASYPAEACGVLVGTRSGAAGCVEGVHRAANLSADPTRYDLDPGALVRAEDEARAGGREVIGIWHSHPDRPARPSEADLESAWSGWSHLVVSVGPRGVAELRSWRLSAGACVEEELLR